MGRQKNKPYGKLDFYFELFFVVLFTVALIWIGITGYNYNYSQKTLAEELMAYTKTNPPPIVEGTVYEAKTSFGFKIPGETRDRFPPAERRTYFYLFAVGREYYSGVTTVKHHNSTGEPLADAFWLPSEGEKIRIIFNPADPGRNMALEWAERVIGWEVFSRGSRLGAVLSMAVLSPCWIYIIWKYLKWIKPKNKK
jgi:hypothetical protein